MEALKLLGKLIIKGKIKVLTGLHIGDAQGSIEIGGVDNAVIKDANGKPYIPGSSLKGKLRSLLERFEGYLSPDSLVNIRSDDNPIKIHICDLKDCPVCLLFGRSIRADSSNPKRTFSNVTPTRLQVRDALLDEKSLEPLKGKLALEYTEVKFENSLDRFTSAANPRQTERVPRGAEFDFEMVLNILHEKDKNLVGKLLTAMALLEDDCLGGGGSRGYGRVEFSVVQLFWRSRQQYETGQFADEPIATGKIQDLSANDIVAKLV